MKPTGFSIGLATLMVSFVFFVATCILFSITFYNQGEVIRRENVLIEQRQSAINLLSRDIEVLTKKLDNLAVVAKTAASAATAANKVVQKALPH